MPEKYSKNYFKMLSIRYIIGYSLINSMNPTVYIYDFHE